MLNNSTIILIRHAEKPVSGVRLSQEGKQRAAAYIAYFQHYVLDHRPIEWDYLIATADSAHSSRPRLTITPLAQALNIPLNTPYSDADYNLMADDLLTQPHYANRNILIAWHHSTLLDLAEALGVKANKLADAAKWPTVWPPDVFGWVLQIRFDEEGKVWAEQTKCFNQNLMFNDHGKNPPTATA